jgi:ferric-dicitrate binding protein FerR (iron transport regulator)
MPAGRDAAIARIADALRARARTQRRRRAVVGLSLAAAIVVLLGGGVLITQRSHREAGVATAPENLGRLVDPTGAVTALRDGHTEAVTGGARLPEGTELRTTGTTEASLDFDTGTHVTLGGASRVRLVEQSARKRFALEMGSFSAKVAKLRSDERFVVTTPDAEVEVRGTAFRVALVQGDPSCEGGTPTRLDVSEGVVVVTHAGSQIRVAAGEHWPLCAVTAPALRATGTAEPTALSPSGPATSTAKTVAKSVAVAPRPTEAVASTPSSRLAEQNDLFDEAMRSKRAGNGAVALVKLDRLLADYPGGPLAESAAAERMRVLATTDKARAAAAAREYLRLHPRGFARAEAEAITTGSP